MQEMMENDLNLDEEEEEEEESKISFEDLDPKEQYTAALETIKNTSHLDLKRYLNKGNTTLSAENLKKLHNAAKAHSLRKQQPDIQISNNGYKRSKFSFLSRFRKTKK